MIKSLVIQLLSCACSQAISAVHSRGSGVSSISGIWSSRGSAMSMAKNSGPIIPFPTGAWRSTREPTPFAASLRCMPRRYPNPTVRSNSSHMRL